MTLESTLKVSVLQHDASLKGSETRFAWLAEKAEIEVSKGAQLLVCPELFMTGYNVGEELHRCAEPADGDFSRRIQSLAKMLNVAILYGYPESFDGRVFNSAILIDADGGIVVNHRKSVLPDGIEGDWFDTGDALSVFSFNGIAMALLICYECEFPEAVRQVVAHGAEVVLVCTACGWDQVPNLVVPSRAYENGVYMVYANIAGVENGHPFTGLSCIVDAYGRDMARAGKDEEIISATLDINQVAEARRQLPYVRDYLKVPSVAK